VILLPERISAPLYGPRMPRPRPATPGEAGEISRPICCRRRTWEKMQGGSGPAREAGVVAGLRGGVAICDHPRSATSGR
jgi:hypothetical protein